MKIKELIGDLQSYGALSEFDSDAQIDRLNQQFKSPLKNIKNKTELNLLERDFDMINLPVVLEEVTVGSADVQSSRPCPKKFNVFDTTAASTSREFFVEKSTSKNSEEMNKTYGFSEMFSVKNLCTKTSSPLKIRMKKFQHWT